MNYSLPKAIEVLSRTPDVLTQLLSNLSDEWLHGNEGPQTWSPFEVVGHLVINEETNFFKRTLVIVSEEMPPTLQPIDMTSHLTRFQNITVNDLLSKFKTLRISNLQKLKALNLSESDLQKLAIHPKLGEVKLSQILSTWVAHDLLHIGQITRTMAKQCKEATGPFIHFLTKIQ